MRYALSTGKTNIPVNTVRTIAAVISQNMGVDIMRTPDLAVGCWRPAQSIWPWPAMVRGVRVSKCNGPLKAGPCGIVTVRAMVRHQQTVHVVQARPAGG